jgi:hypothetical protein
MIGHAAFAEAVVPISANEALGKRGKRLLSLCDVRSWRIPQDTSNRTTFMTFDFAT